MMRLTDQEENNRYRWWFGYFPAIALSVALIFTSAYVVSLYYVMSPRIAMDEWACNGKVGDELAWNDALVSLETAKKFDPWNAEIYLDMGRLYEWKALSGSAWNASAKDARSKASDYFKQAAIQRPTWALAWVSYAQSQLVNRVIDEETFLAISNGYKFGRWQMTTQKKLLWLSIGIWDRLPANIQQQVRDQIRDVLQKQGGIEMLVSIAVRFQWFDELIPLISNSDDLDYVDTVRNQPQKMRDMLKGGSQSQQFVCRVSA